MYRRDSKKAAEVVLGKNHLGRKILVALGYDTAKVALDRKKETADEILATTDQHQSWLGYPLTLLEAAYEELGSWKAVAKSLGTSRSMVDRMRKRALLAVS